MSGPGEGAIELVDLEELTPPAFAVTRHQDGSVSVQINSRSGIAGATRAQATLARAPQAWAPPGT